MEGSSSASDTQRRVVFQVGGDRFGIDARRVLEVIRPTHVTRVPNGPDALKGIANLRGRPLAVLSVSRLLNGGAGASPSDGKIIVYDHDGPIGLLVDAVLHLSSDASVLPLQGLGEMLDTNIKVSQRGAIERARSVDTRAPEEVQSAVTWVLSFRVAGQLYGLSLEHVREVLAHPGDIATVAGSTPGMIGLMPMRDGVLPVASLASLLGLRDDDAITAASRIVLVEHDGDMVGLAVDAMEVIYRLPEEAIDPVPAVLRRGRGNAQIAAIGRIAQAGLLVSILSPEKLFGHDALASAVGQNTGAASMTIPSETKDAVEQFLIFEIGDEHYGLPVASVDEVIRVPADITRLPGAPAFVAGVINLRGKAVPLIDQRSRFDAPDAKTKQPRAIIVTLSGRQAGFIVDGVAEMKAVPSSALSAAPEFSSRQTDVFDRIAHIEADNRMILLVNPQELLTRAERDVVAAFADETAAGH